MADLRSFQKQLAKEKIDAAILLNNAELIDTSFFYFTGLKTEYEVLIVPKKGNPIILSSLLEYERVKKTSKIKEIIKAGSKKEFEDAIRKHLKSKTIGMNKDFVPINLAKTIKKTGDVKEIKDISKMLTELRAVKTDEEQAILKKACQISRKVFEKTIEALSRGRLKTELQIKEYLEAQIRANLCTPSFPTIIASGKNASMPHHEPTSRLNKGFLIIDFGVNYQGYCSDITRTIYLGNPSEKEITTYYQLLGLQEEAIKDCIIGSDYLEIFRSVKKVLKEKLIHGLGHGLGIDVHEPLAADNKKIKLKPGNYLTIEPGIYEQGKFGIRIEDDVLITKKGPVVFSKNIPKDLIIIT